MVKLMRISSTNTLKNDGESRIFGNTETKIVTHRAESMMLQKIDVDRKKTHTRN